MNTIKQTATPLNNLFFSEFNRNILQRAIRDKFYKETGVKIDYQNNDDLFTIMRYVFINNQMSHYDNIYGQVKNMNMIVIKTALSHVRTGVSQFLGYINDIATMAVPLAPPINTSTYGNKMPENDKIRI